VGENLSKAYYDKYADYLSKVVQYFNTSLGIPFRTIEPFNESNPQDGGFNWPNGCTSQCQEGANFLPQTQNTIIALLCKKLAGSATTVSAPDENSIDTTIATYKNYDDATKACISQVNTHSYQGDKRDELCKLVLGDVQGHCMQTSNKRLWMSEYSNGGDSPINAALQLSLEINQDMNEMHPSAWVYWQAVESNEQGGKNYGLLRAPFCSPNTDTTISGLNSKNDLCKSGNSKPYSITQMKQYYAMANYSWFIRPGDLILNVDEGKHTLAAFDPRSHTLTIVATNDDTKDHSVTYNLQHFTSVTGSVSPYTTSVDKNADNNHPSPAIPISGTQFTAPVPSQSITTYVIPHISMLTPSTTELSIDVHCTSTGQLCNPPFETPVKTGSVLKIEYVVPGHCSSIRLHIFVDGKEVTTTGFLGWPGASGQFASLPIDTGILDLSPVTPGQHVLALQAEGQVGGCNSGQLIAWGGTVRTYA